MPRTSDLSKVPFAVGDRVLWRRYVSGGEISEFPATVLRITRTHASIRFDRPVLMPRGALVKGTNATLKMLRKAPA